jgi:hypothetical protein
LGKEKLTFPVRNSCADSGETVVLHIIRAEFAVAAIALVANVAAPGAINEWCSSAHAQTQTTSPEPTIWDHNGSVVYLVANGQSREFYYRKPRAGMLDAGAHPDSLLFRGEIDNGKYSGTAYIFNRHCGQIPFQVEGTILDNDERIMLTGQAPRVARNCGADESYTSNLEFRLVKQNKGVQSQEQFNVRPTPTVEESKVAVPSSASGEVPGAPTPQPSERNDGTSQSASAYVAGRGKYCKESALSPNLDCFYASLDACEKHNKSANVRCVANPNPNM